jgi:hypothetical protein
VLLFTAKKKKADPLSHFASLSSLFFFFFFFYKTQSIKGISRLPADRGRHLDGPWDEARL